MTLRCNIQRFERVSGVVLVDETTLMNSGLATEPLGYVFQGAESSRVPEDSPEIAVEYSFRWPSASNRVSRGVGLLCSEQQQMLADHHSANRFGAAGSAFKRRRASLDQGIACEPQSERAQVELQATHVLM